MIEFKQGDILESDAEALVNTVNCVSVMGRGIALQFKLSSHPAATAHAANTDVALLTFANLLFRGLSFARSPAGLAAVEIFERFPVLLESGRARDQPVLWHHFPDVFQRSFSTAFPSWHAKGVIRHPYVHWSKP